MLNDCALTAWFSVPDDVGPAKRNSPPPTVIWVEALTPTSDHAAVKVLNGSQNRYCSPVMSDVAASSVDSAMAVVGTSPTMSEVAGSMVEFSESTAAGPIMSEVAGSIVDSSSSAGAASVNANVSGNVSPTVGGATTGPPPPVPPPGLVGAEVSMSHSLNASNRVDRIPAACTSFTTP